MHPLYVCGVVLFATTIAGGVVAGVLLYPKPLRYEIRAVLLIPPLVVDTSAMTVWLQIVNLALVLLTICRENALTLDKHEALVEESVESVSCVVVVGVVGVIVPLIVVFVCTSPEPQLIQNKKKKHDIIILYMIYLHLCTYAKYNVSKKICQ